MATGPHDDAGGGTQSNARGGAPRGYGACRYVRKTSRQERTSPPDVLEDALGLRTLGLMLFLCGAVGHVGVDLLLLSTACASQGCLQPGCHPWRPPDQCLPSYSDVYPRTYWPSYSDMWTASGGRELRHVRGWQAMREEHGLALLAATLVLRAMVEPLLLWVGYRRLQECPVDRAGAGAMDGSDPTCPPVRSLAFLLGSLLVAIFTVGEVAVPNFGRFRAEHQLLACALVGIWLALLVPMYWYAIHERSRAFAKVLGVLWGLSGILTFLLRVTWKFKFANWFSIEWTLVLTHGVTIAVIGVALASIESQAKAERRARDVDASTTLPTWNNFEECGY